MKRSRLTIAKGGIYQQSIRDRTPLRANRACCVVERQISLHEAALNDLLAKQAASRRPNPPQVVVGPMRRASLRQMVLGAILTGFGRFTARARGPQ